MARKSDFAQTCAIVCTLSLPLLLPSAAWAAVVNVRVNVPIVHPKVAIVNVKPHVPHVAITAGSGSAIGSQSRGAGTGKVKFSDLHITKTVDTASPSLFKSATRGTAKAALASSCKVCGVAGVSGGNAPRAPVGAVSVGSGAGATTVGSGAGATTGVATTVFGVPKGATVGGPGTTPPAVLAKYGQIAAKLDPAALGWLAQQGKTLSQSPGVAFATVQAAIAQHFGSQLRSNPDAAALALVVLVEAINNANQDLQQVMTTIQDQTAAKQALRNQINALNQQAATNGRQSEVGGRDQSQNGAQIQFGGTPSPTQVPTDGVPISIGGSLVAPAQGGGAVSTSAVGTAVATLQNDLDSDNEMSEMTSMRLQMLMDMRSKLLQTASDLEKSISGTGVAISGSIKQ